MYKRRYSWGAPQIIVTIAGEDVASPRIREKMKQVKIPPDKRKHSYDNKIDRLPTGILILDAGTDFHGVIQCQDGDSGSRIEDHLNKVVESYIRAAGRQRLQRHIKAEEERKRLEQERIKQEREEALRQKRQELQRRQAEEQAKVDELIHHANSWKQSHVLREYLDAICDYLMARDGIIRMDGEAAEYLRWGHQQADRMDPLKSSPPSVLDEEIEEE